ncbi:MAG: hypothetical protein FWC70_07310, partial [Defluviitaleaceae bacterium]|nr:hypothetical protein [Defluviitaleaceae bacterium]
MRKKKSTFGKIFALLVAFTMLATSFPYTAVAGIGAGNDVGDATNLIAISPTEILLLPGESEQLEYILAAALGEYRIEWALTGDVAPGTEITADGLLTVCESEAVGVPISVTATVYVPADAPDDVYDDDYADDDTDVLFPDDDYADDDTDVYIPDDDYADDSDVHVPDDDDADMYPPPCDVPDDDSAANDGSDAPDNDDASDDSAAAGNDDASDDSAAASDNGDTSDDSDAASDNGDISDDSDAADNGDVSDDSAAADNGDTSDDSSAPDNGDASDDSSASAAPDNGSVAGDDSDAFAPDASGSDSDSANGVYVLGAYIDDANVATYANDSTDAADATDSIAATDANYATDAIDASSPAYVADGNAYAIDAAWVAIAYVSVPVHVISGIVPTAILAPGMMWCLSNHPDTPAHGFMSDTAHSASTEIFARTSDATIAINGGVLTLAGRTGGANAIGVNIEAMGLNPDVNEYRVRIAGRIDNVTATGGVFRIAGRDPNVTIIDVPILPGGEFDVTIDLPASNWPGAGGVGYPILRLLTNTNAAVQTNDIIIDTFTVSTVVWCLSDHPDAPAHGFMSDTAHSASTEIFARTSDATIAINGGVMTLAGRTGGANAIGVNIEAMGLNPDVNEYRVRIAGRIDGVTATGGVFRIAGRDPNVTIIDEPILPGGEFDVTIILPATNWPGAVMGYPILRLLTNTNAAVQTNDIIIETFTVYGEVGDNPLREAAAAVRGALNSFDASNDTTAAEVLTAAQGAVTAAALPVTITAAWVAAPTITPAQVGVAGSIVGTIRLTQNPTIDIDVSLAIPALAAPPTFGYLFDLQAYLATRTIGENLRLAGASPYFVSTHPTEAVEILVQDAGLG